MGNDGGIRGWVGGQTRINHSAWIKDNLQKPLLARGGGHMHRINAGQLLPSPHPDLRRRSAFLGLSPALLYPLPCLPLSVDREQEPVPLPQSAKTSLRPGFSLCPSSLPLSPPITVSLPPCFSLAACARSYPGAALQDERRRGH